MQLRAVHYALATAVLVAAAALLNPSAEQHREKIKQAVAERSQLAALFRLGDLAAFVSRYHSVGLASYTTANDKVLSVGALGIVFVPDPSKSK
jgi:cytochrome c556